MNILSEILSSRVRAELFRILWSSVPSECHLRDLVRKAGMTVGSIQQEVRKLERLGLLIRRVDGNRAYFRANPSHPLFENIRQLVLKTVGLAEVLRSALIHEKIQGAFVFGSMAQGNANAESDIDLFIIGTIGLRDLSKLLKEPVQLLGREINPHVLRPEEWIRRLQEKEHFVSSVAQSAKVVIIGGENEFNGLVRKRVAETPPK